MITDLQITSKWYINDIPRADVVAPWQLPNLDTINMKPDMSNQIRYKLNSYGYRDIEWTESDLNDSIWCVGHSDTMGMGVEHTETWSYRLGSLTKSKTVNLGIAGASYDTFSRVIGSGLSKYKPKTIIIQGTTPERKEYITQDFQQLVLPSFTRDMLPHDNVWKYTDNVTEQYEFERNINLIQYACIANNVQLIMFDLPDRWDYIKLYPAKDNLHIGPYIHEQISQWLFSKYLSNGANPTGLPSDIAM